DQRRKAPSACGWLRYAGLDESDSLSIDMTQRRFLLLIPAAVILGTIVSFGFHRYFDSALTSPPFLRSTSASTVAERVTATKPARAEPGSRRRPSRRHRRWTALGEAAGFAAAGPPVEPAGWPGASQVALPERSPMAASSTWPCPSGACCPFRWVRIGLA